jgi:hypothetical protein
LGLVLGRRRGQRILDEPGVDQLSGLERGHVGARPQREEEGVKLLDGRRREDDGFFDFDFFLKGAMDR